MVEFGFVVLGALGLGGGLALAFHRRYEPMTEARLREMAAHGLATSRCLLLTIKALQRHRGMSSALLGGDRSFEDRLESTRIEIDQALLTLAAHARRETEMPWPCFSYIDFTHLRHEWEVLVAELRRLTIEESIARHSRLVDQTLEWLAAIGDARLALVLKSQLPGGLAGNYAYRLPALAETLGLARAVGSGAAARHYCSPPTRGKLIFLVSRAENLLTRMEGLFVDGRTTQACTQVTRLLSVIRGELIEPRAVSLDAKTYFDQATQVIDGLFACIDASALDLEKVVESPLQMA